MSYWNEIDEYNRREHERDMKFLKKQHEYKMEELRLEVELYDNKRKLDDCSDKKECECK
jgi:hypothetical protein